MTFSPGDSVQMRRDVGSSSAYLLTHSYWRNAQKARDPEHAMNAQAMLWGLATSPSAPERIRRAAFHHLEVIGESPLTQEIRA